MQGEMPDVIVVGAGVIGCASAWAMARRGARVLVVDMRDVGRGATQASAGILAPHVEAHSGALLELGTRSLALYDELIHQVEADSGTPIEYSRCGTLEVALDNNTARQFRVTCDSQRAAGIDAEYLDRTALREAEPLVTESAVAGLLVSTHGYVSPPDLVTALARAAASHGATFRHGIVVRRIRQQGGEVVVHAGGEILHASSVVIANGAWAGDIELAVGDRELPHPHVQPVRGQLLRLWTRARLAHVTWGPRCYLVPWSDGTTLVGATSEHVGFDERATAEGVRDLLTAASELVPALGHAEFREVRVGLRPATPDELPIVGRCAGAPRIVIAAGHYRNGILLTPLTAALVADLVLDGREDPALARLSVERFAAART
jgi:glycine oxidase